MWKSTDQVGAECLCIYLDMRHDVSLRSILLISLIGPSTVSAQRKLRPSYPLPARAKVVVDGTYNGMAADNPDHNACDGFRTSRQQIRRFFLVDRELDGPDVHNGIDQFACGIHGRVLLDGKTYSWDLRMTLEDGFITTDYPDGTSKYLAHTVGDLSDDPHPHRPSRYIDLKWWKK